MIADIIFSFGLIIFFCIANFYKKQYDKLLFAIKQHQHESHDHENCHLNDRRLWIAAGLLDRKRYWPPVDEMKSECDRYIESHHPDYQSKRSLSQKLDDLVKEHGEKYDPEVLKGYNQRVLKIKTK